MPDDRQDNAEDKAALHNHASPQPLAPQPQSANALSPDLLQGAGAIAEFLFGEQHQRRRVYHLVETKALPVFRLGALLCARRTTLLKWVEAQEAAAGCGINPSSGARS